MVKIVLSDGGEKSPGVTTSNKSMHWVLFRSEKKKNNNFEEKNGSFWNYYYCSVLGHVRHQTMRREQCFVLELAMGLSGIFHTSQETTLKFYLEAFSRPIILMFPRKQRVWASVIKKHPLLPVCLHNKIHFCRITWKLM